ncbi:hypothetical protein BU26DRAFT_570184 [Trematosphaeria pertusa]|uniref:Uncharacterized protein n=1 Tax=Trematosphaeria pertusa TaxID=390896 RepID=A0A6A6HZ32_9PLEO|nr:uncharacterized protein BU26DRAFT_570184 [Trematosphaeria pertusa]KAF2243494.1 hypothetical protein BU26DRAFT_570184 [Trematosphaeria pertusa]
MTIDAESRKRKLIPEANQSTLEKFYRPVVEMAHRNPNPSAPATPTAVKPQHGHPRKEQKSLPTPEPWLFSSRSEVPRRFESIELQLPELPPPPMLHPKILEGLAAAKKNAQEKRNGVVDVSKPLPPLPADAETVPFSTAPYRNSAASQQVAERFSIKRKPVPNYSRPMLLTELPVAPRKDGPLLERRSRSGAVKGQAAPHRGGERRTHFSNSTTAPVEARPVETHGHVVEPEQLERVTRRGTA